jgi:hypothetical protein
MAQREPVGQDQGTPLGDGQESAKSGLMHRNEPTRIKTHDAIFPIRLHDDARDVDVTPEG